MEMTELEIAGSYRRAGETPEQIKVLAELNAVKPSLIREILRVQGFDIPAEPGPKGQGPARKLNRKKAMALYEQGFADRAIGRALGVSDVAVGNWRRTLGLPSQQQRAALQQKPASEAPPEPGPESASEPAPEPAPETAPVPAAEAPAVAMAPAGTQGRRELPEIYRAIEDIMSAVPDWAGVEARETAISCAMVLLREDLRRRFARASTE